MKKIGNRTFVFSQPISISSYAAIGGKKEKQGPLGKCFDICFEDELLGEDSFEKAESRLQQFAVSKALTKGSYNPEDIDVIFAGDLLNQCISSTFGLMDFEIPFAGLYGACSTMVLGLIMSAMTVGAGAKNTVAVTSSHFCSSERQFRFPLEYGGQRTPTAQWTATASGAAVVSQGSGKINLAATTIGKIVDLGVSDANNMGAAMAPDDVKIRPYPRGVGAWDLDSFSVVIFALAAFKMLEMPKAFFRFSPCQNKNNLT